MKKIISKLLSIFFERRMQGQSLLEFILILPVAFLFIIMIIESSLTGVRSTVATHGAMRAARVSSVYQRELAKEELFAMLTPVFFENREIISRKGAGHMEIEAIANPIVRIPALYSSVKMKRASPQIYSLSKGLTNKVLQGGDTPSPYCELNGEYSACGYPK